MGTRRKLVELGKDILIVLLLCSAAYLFWRTQLSLSPGGQPLLPGGITGLFTGGTNPSGPNDSIQNADPSTLRPVRMVFTDGTSQGRWGIQYSTETDAVFESVGGLLAEGLSNAAPPTTSSQSAFRTALNRSGIYFDFLGALPLDTLSLWLAGAETPALAGHTARRLCLSVTADGGAALYYINENDGLYYVSILSSDLAGRLSAAAEARGTNRARFAFEAGEAYSLLSPLTVLLTELPRPQSYTVRSPLGILSADSPTAALEALLAALDFNPGLGGLYQSPDGLVARAGADSLRITPGGGITYRAPEDGEPRYPASDPATAARLLAEGTAGALCGAARLYLISAVTEASRTTVTFGYCLEGAAVSLPGGTAAAQVVVEDGFIVEFTLTLRHYEATGNTPPLLPELQAAAAAEGLETEGGELLLRFEDSGNGSCMPVWGI